MLSREYWLGIRPMKDYAEPTVETYGSIEKLSEKGSDSGYGGRGGRGGDQGRGRN